MAVAPLRSGRRLCSRSIRHRRRVRRLVDDAHRPQALRPERRLDGGSPAGTLLVPRLLLPGGPASRHRDDARSGSTSDPAENPGKTGPGRLGNLGRVRSGRPGQPLHVRALRAQRRRAGSDLSLARTERKAAMDPLAGDPRDRRPPIPPVGAADAGADGAARRKPQDARRRRGPPLLRATH